MNDNTLPPHLGGHENMTHIDIGALDYFIEKYNIKSFLDVGCGPGGMVELAHDSGLDALGIDGDYTVKRINPQLVMIHDFTVGKPFLNHKIYDLGWSCEFLEHVPAEFMDNYMDAFFHCKRIAVTHALPGQGGHHHVNEKDANYWLDEFMFRGFLFDINATNELRKNSSMDEKFVRHTGLVFWNSNLNWVVKE